MLKLNVRKISPFREFDYVQLKGALAAYAQPHAKIRQLLASGSIIRVKKGVYVLGDEYRDEPIMKEVLANMIYGPSAISLDWALSHYGLIPEYVSTVTSITPSRNKYFETPMGGFSYRYLAMNKYCVGLVRWQLTDKRYVLMASLEKALIDKIYCANNLDLLSIEDFLFSDLRMGEEIFTRLNRALFSEIVSIYNNKRVDALSTYFEGKI